MDCRFSLDSMPSLVHLHICHFLSGSDIINMSMVDRKWHNIISGNRHSLPKKHITLGLDMFGNKEKSPKLLMTVEQKGSHYYYGIRLKKFNEIHNNRFKKADSFDGNDINEIALENGDKMPTKYIDDIDSGIEQLISTITAKVDIQMLTLCDVNPDILRFFAKCFSEHRTRVCVIFLKFSEGCPQESVDLLDSIRACRDVTIVCSDPSDSPSDVLPIGILETKAIRESRMIEIRMMECLSRKTSANQKTGENYDEQITSLSAEVIEIHGTRLTAQGANLLITQWQSGQRDIRRNELEISTDISEFHVNSVFKGVQHYQRLTGQDSPNHFLVGRISNGNRQIVHVSWDECYFLIDQYDQ